MTLSAVVEANSGTCLRTSLYWTRTAVPPRFTRCSVCTAAVRSLRLRPSPRASNAALVAEWGLDAVRSFVVPLWTAFHGALPSPAEARQSISSLHSPRGSFVCRTACGMNRFHCRLMNLPFNLLTQPTNHRSTIGFYTDLARVFHWRKFPHYSSLMS